MMERIRKRSLPGILILAFLLHLILVAAQGREGLRKVKIGETMPEFSLPRSNGGTLTYKHNQNKVSVLAFLPTTQRRIKRAVTDIETLRDSLQEHSQRLVFIGVVSGPAANRVAGILPAIRGRDALDAEDKPGKPGSKHPYPILLDDNFQLWGRLGVIAVPTLIIVGQDDKIEWIKAGYGYDFVPVARAHLKQALGIAQETPPKDTPQVKTVTNSTTAARIQRHLQMAKLLEKKGQIDSAIGELKKATELDPNSINPTFELVELLCRNGRNREALDLIERIRTERKSEKARLLSISGWARRQMGELSTAEKLLTKAISLNPRSIRALFELGKIYQTRGQTEKAMNSYYTALSLLLDEPEGMQTSEEKE